MTLAVVLSSLCVADTAHSQERSLHVDLTTSFRDLVGYIVAHDHERAQLAFARMEFVLDALKHPPRTPQQLTRYERALFELECQEILRTEIAP